MMNKDIKSPVVVNIWCRSDYQKKQFQVIKSVKPTIIILASDGGRNDKEWEAIKYNRSYIEKEIDWECEIHRIYQDSNIGIWNMLQKCEEYVWDRFDRCIYLEDDILPSESFFYYCDELLERYKDDLRVNVICGMNHLGKYDCGESDYFFSKQGSIWGFAMWKRTYEVIKKPWTDLDRYGKELLFENLKSDVFVKKWLEEYLSNKTTSGHRPGPEFYFMLGIYGENQLQIVPKTNMICCMNGLEGGADSDSLKRLPKAIRKLFNMRTYEIDFPLKHPDAVLPDYRYEKKRNRIMAYNHPMINFLRKIEHGWYVLLDGDILYLKRKILKK